MVADSEDVEVGYKHNFGVFDVTFASFVIVLLHTIGEQRR